MSGGLKLCTIKRVFRESCLHAGSPIYLANLIFSRRMSEQFCNETLTSLSPSNLALHVATVPCKASNNLRACQSRSAWYSTIEKIFVSNN